MSDKQMKKIFVNIASHRDKFLPLTIKSLLSNESGRNIITYGIFEQEIFENSLEAKHPELVHHNRVRYKRIDPQYTEGVMWARCINSMQLQDEEFQYQIDSHMLFDKAWDNYLIFDYMQAKEIANTEKVILTAGTKNFDFKDNKIIKHTLTEDITTSLKYIKFEDNLQLEVHGTWIPATQKVEPTIHICAGNFFTISKWISDIGYDTNVFFAGEEQIMALQSILGGYKVYNQRKVKTYHYLNTANYETKPYIKPIIPQKKIDMLQFNSRKYINDYIYSLGEERLLYFRYLTGVDYINKILEERARSPQSLEKS